MSTTLPATAEHRGDHPPQPGARTARARNPPRRLGLLDRVALRLGLLLITWSRRPHRTREELRLRRQQELDNENRLLDAQRLLLLSLAPR